MTTPFHEAARDGHLDQLREATKRDCNRPDDSGMTPTLLAAYNGRVDALRLIVSRGGDLGKSDHLGHTALHFAALSGHMAVVEYLNSFGCNVWALNNEYRTAMQLAAENGKRQIVDFLDDVAGRQAATNKKVVQKAKEKAVKDADERVKKYNKMVKEYEKIRMKEAKKRGSIVEVERPSAGDTNPSFSDVTQSTHTKSSDRKRGDGDGDSINDPSGVGDNNLLETGLDSEGANPRFWIPNRNSMAMTSLPKENDAEDIEDALKTLDSIHQEHGDISPSESAPTSPRDSGYGFPQTSKPEDLISPLYKGDQHVKSEVDIALDDEADPLISALEIFLTVNGLEDYIPVFFEEDIDMKALEMLTEQDILDLRLPLGPRRKLSQAITKRKESLASPGVIRDSSM